jgi:hypothetical protein
MKVSWLLLLPASLRLALVQGVRDKTEYGSQFDANGLGQEVLESLCPEYGRYALHFQ